MLLIRAVRLVRGLTQETVARLARISRPHLSRIERDKCRPSPSVCDRLATTLGFEADQLFDPAEVADTPADRPD